MSLLARLRELFHLSEPDRDRAEDEAPLTVAALLVLVARIDGRLLDAEEESLRVLLRDRLGLSSDAAASLIDRAAALDLDPAVALPERILHDIPAAERAELLAMAYGIAAADGQVHDFEDDLLWRVGGQLGLSERDMAGIREGALSRPHQRER